MSVQGYLDEKYYWSDFTFSVNNLRTNPATAKPDFSYTEGEFLFDDSSTETVVGSQITQHSFKLKAEEWRPHVHWIQDSAGVVVWQLEYKFIPVGEEEPASYTTLTTTSSDFTYTSGTIHQRSFFDPIDMSSYNSMAILCKVKISRLGGDALDTKVGDVRFMGFDFHVPIDRFGSEQEKIKEI